MVKETKASPKTSDSSEVRRKSPGRPKSPARKSTVSKSPVQSKTSEAAKKSAQSKSSTRKSPTRTKSPARNSPARNKSPARIKKETSPVQRSPKHKSPSRTTIGDIRISARKTTIQPTRIETELSGSDEEYIPKEKPKATVRGRSRKLELDEVVQANIKLTDGAKSNNTYVGEIRRITRNSQAQEERVVRLKHFDTVTKKLGEFSDDDEISLLSNKTPEKKRKSSIFESIGIFVQIIFSSVFVIGLYILCDNIHCSFTSLPDLNRYKMLSLFFDLRAFLSYSALAIALSVFGAAPFGGPRVTNLPSKQGKFIYVANGFASLVVVLIVCAILEYFRFPVSKFVSEHIVQFIVSATVFGFAFSVYLYLRSFHVSVSCLNPTEIGGPPVNAFFYGREVNPRLLNILDLKIYVLRIRCISLVLADLALLIKGLNLDTKLASTTVTNFDWKLFTSHPTLLVLVALHLIHSLDSLCFESRSLSSYFIQYEGLGYKTAVGILLSPFLLIAQTKYVVDYNINLANWELVLISLLYFGGYFVYRLSNNQKDAFRRNPYSPVSSNLDSIATSQGKKLLCSGYWGLVRQPNIMGDILMHATLFRFCYNAPSLIGILAIILMLIERSVNNQIICKSKYGAAWEKYCHKVKYVLVPKVY